MRKILFILCVAAASLACGGKKNEYQAAAPAPNTAGGYGTTAGSATTGAAGASSFVAQVVAVDRDGPSVTLKQPSSTITTGDRTIKVEGDATSALASLKPGDQVRVACRAVALANPAPPAVPGARGAANPDLTPGAAGTSGGTNATGATSSGTGPSIAATTITTDLGSCESVVALNAMTGGATGR